MATPAIWAQVTWKEVAHFSCEHWMQAPRFWRWHNTHFCHGNREQTLVIWIKGTSLFCDYRSILVGNISIEMLHLSAGVQCQTPLKQWEDKNKDKTTGSPVDPWIPLIYQILAWLGNGADIHWLPVDGIDEARFRNSDATDDVDPPGWRAERCHMTAGNESTHSGVNEWWRRTNRLSTVIFRAPPRKLQRQHSWKKEKNNFKIWALTPAWVSRDCFGAAAHHCPRSFCTPWACPGGSHRIRLNAIATCKKNSFYKPGFFGGCNYCVTQHEQPLETFFKMTNLTFYL